MQDFKEIYEDFLTKTGPRLVVLGSPGSTYAYLLNRSMATLLLEQIEKSHAKDFLSISDFFKLQCQDGHCDQVKFPLVHRDNVLQRLQNLVHIQIGNARPQGASRNSSRT